MSAEEAVVKYVISHYGNLVLNDSPEFDEASKLWIARLRSDYPVYIQNDLTSERVLSFIKISTLGYVAFDEKMRPNREIITPRQEVVSRLVTCLNMWRSYAENIMVTASADRIAKLPEVTTALNPVHEILLSLFEDGRVRTEDLVSGRRSDKKMMKSHQYLSLLEELHMVRRHGEEFLQGNAFVALCEKHPDFERLSTAVFSEVLRRRYSYLREVIGLSNLERIVRVGNIVYYPELHARSAVPRGWSTLVNEFAKEYEVGISSNSMRSNLYKLKRVKVINRSDGLYHGVNVLRKRMLTLQTEMPSPETVWSVPRPV
jgi:hypothetical protein